MSCQTDSNLPLRSQSISSYEDSDTVYAARTDSHISLIDNINPRYSNYCAEDSHLCHGSISNAPASSSFDCSSSGLVNGLTYHNLSVVFEYIDKHDLTSFRSVCKYFRAIIDASRPTDLLLCNEDGVIKPLDNATCSLYCRTMMFLCTGRRININKIVYKHVIDARSDYPFLNLLSMMSNYKHIKMLLFTDEYLTRQHSALYPDDYHDQHYAGSTPLEKGFPWKDSLYGGGELILHARELKVLEVDLKYKYERCAFYKLPVCSPETLKIIIRTTGNSFITVPDEMRKSVTHLNIHVYKHHEDKCLTFMDSYGRHATVAELFPGLTTLKIHKVSNTAVTIHLSAPTSVPSFTYIGDTSLLCNLEIYSSPTSDIRSLLYFTTPATNVCKLKIACKKRKMLNDLDLYTELKELRIDKCIIICSLPPSLKLLELSRCQVLDELVIPPAVEHVVLLGLILERPLSIPKSVTSLVVDVSPSGIPINNTVPDNVKAVQIICINIDCPFTNGAIVLPVGCRFRLLQGSAFHEV